MSSYFDLYFYFDSYFSVFLLKLWRYSAYTVPLCLYLLCILTVALASSVLGSGRVGEYRPCRCFPVFVFLLVLLCIFSGWILLSIFAPDPPFALLWSSRFLFLLEGKGVCGLKLRSVPGTDSPGRSWEPHGSCVVLSVETFCDDKVSLSVCLYGVTLPTCDQNCSSLLTVTHIGSWYLVW